MWASATICLSLLIILVIISVKSVLTMCDFIKKVKIKKLKIKTA